MKRDKALASLLALILAFSLFAPIAIADAPQDELTYGEDGADPVWLDVNTLTIAKHPMAEGGSHSDMAGFENDSGIWVSDPPFIVNTSIGEDVDDDEEGNRNPYTFNPAYVETDQFGAFPRVGDDEDDEDTDDPASEDNLASALDASEWTETENASEVAISDTTIAADVEAVRFDSGTSFVSGDEYEAQYANWTDELDSDESKRVIQLAGEVDTLEAGARIDINITDESGDWKTVEINGSSSASETSQDVAATGTGTFYYQEKLSDLTTNGGGTWDNIESIEINASGTTASSDFDVSFSWIDLESKGKDTFGETVVDDDDDDSDFDNTEENYNGTGTIDVHDMTTLDPVFDDASITDVQFPAKFRVQDLDEAGDDADYKIEWNTSTKYANPNILTTHYRLILPDAVDLSYSGTSLEMTQAWPSSRYIELGLYEDAGGDEFSEIADDDNFADQTGSLGTEDDEVELDGTISSNTEYALIIKAHFSDAEKSDIQVNESADDGGDDGGAGAPATGEGGGLLSGISNFLFGTIPGLFISAAGAVLGVLGIRSRVMG